MVLLIIYLCYALATFKSIPEQKSPTERDFETICAAFASKDVSLGSVNFGSIKEKLSKNLELNILYYCNDEYAIAYNNMTAISYYIETSFYDSCNDENDILNFVNQNDHFYLENDYNGYKQFKLTNITLRITPIRKGHQILSYQAFSNPEDAFYIGKVIENYDIENLEIRTSFIKLMMLNMLQAIKFLNANYVTHSQINPNSIVIIKESDKIMFKLIICSSMRMYTAFENMTEDTLIISEEVLDEWEVARNIDIYQLGITAINLFLGENLNLDNDKNFDKLESLNNDVSKFLTKNYITGDFHDFLIDCLQNNPQLFKNAQELLQHPFIKDD
ncbi:hypothetical protein COBT_000647 [Conglomerata obtusa]